MRKLRPELFFLIAVLGAGLWSAVITPLGAGFDEDAHLARVWQIAHGEMIPNRQGSADGFPSGFLGVSYHLYKNMTPVSIGMWARQFEVKIDPSETISFPTRSPYFPLMYIPQALVMRLVLLLFRAPAAILYYLARLSYLALYAGLTFAAIRSLPHGRWLLTVLALSPMAITQASTVTPDAVDNAGAFLFTAWALRLASMGDVPMSDRDFRKTIILIILVCTLKPTTPALLLLLLLVPRRVVGSDKRRAILVSAALSAFLLLSVGWDVVLGRTVGFGSAELHIDPVAQLLGILSAPLAFAHVLGRTLLSALPRVMTEWVGVAPYGAWDLPAVIYVLYPMLLLYTMLSEPSGHDLTLHRRIRLGSIFAVGAGTIIVLVYLQFNPVGSPLIAGIQGRYFIGVSPLLVLCLVPVKPLVRGSRTAVALASFLTLGIWMAAASLSYHIACGESYYRFGLCYLPKYRNWNPPGSRVLPVGGTHVVSQDFVAECDNLTEVRVWTRNNEMAPVAGLEISLAGEASDEVLALGTFNRATIPNDGWLHMTFSPIRNSKKERFSITLRPLDHLVGQAIGVASSRTDEYFEGHVRLDGEDLDGDLLFQYGCRVGLASLLPQTGPYSGGTNP